tara:strand:+ start:512 stop:1615 length:1104 start_codon:yes stop_codon:yes gene_type:complete
MRKSNIVKPTTLKGNDKLDRIRQLMPKVPVNEGITRSVVELTKMGPDGNVYAIVRENHEYFIKISENKDSLLNEDFNYIGGLQNKKDKAYSSYAKAIKQLNLKFMSINEAIGKSGKINVFENDDLVSEHHPLKADMKLSAEKGIGDGQEYVVDSKGAELKYDNKEGKEEDGFGDNVADSTCEKDIEKVKLSENETAIDEMITGDLGGLARLFSCDRNIDEYFEFNMGDEKEVNPLSSKPGESVHARNIRQKLGSQNKPLVDIVCGDYIEVVTQYMQSIGKPNGSLNQMTDEEKDGLVRTAELFDTESGRVYEEKAPIKKGFSIARAIQEMDEVIDSIATEDDKINDIIESLGETEKAIMMEALKKKD